MKDNRFAIDRIRHGTFTEVIIKNKITCEFVSVIPEYGARIMDLQLSNGNNTIPILKKVPGIDSKNRDDIFTNAKLSPFPSRIPDGRYKFKGQEYSLPLNYPEENNACHGFLYDKPYTVSDYIITNDFGECTFKYSYNKELSGYPFNYSIAIIYRLAVEEGLTISTVLTNDSVTAIPIADGWHFYFDRGTIADKLKLKLNTNKYIEFNSRGVPSGNKISFDEFSSLKTIGNRQIDSCFEINTGGKAVAELVSADNNLNISIWQDTAFYKYLVVYIPPDRNSISIEPITSNVNAFNNGEGLIILNPGQQVILNCGIKINI